MRKYIGTKQFYKSVFAIALPIMAQNGISSFVNMLDNLMVGRIGTEQLSGVSIVNDLTQSFLLAIPRRCLVIPDVVLLFSIIGKPGMMGILMMTRMTGTIMTVVEL